MEGAMQRIGREQAVKFAFDWEDAPLLRVQPGERFAMMREVFYLE